MNRTELKIWLKVNLFSDNMKLISKRCRENYFQKNHYENELKHLYECTSYLCNSANITERVWHIMNEKNVNIICHKNDCLNTVHFINYAYGYRKYCSIQCNNNCDEKKLKIQKTNLDRYGNMDLFKTDDFKKKAKDTILKKYGVDNVSKLETNKRKRSVYLSNRRRNTFLEFLQKSIIFNNSYEFIDIELFNGVRNNYKFKCKTCNSIFEDNLIHKYPICRKCNPSATTSFSENEIKNYIKSIYDGVMIDNDRKILNGKELDVYLPDLHFAVEYDGLIYHSEIFGEKDKNYHLNKTLVAKEKDIKLIHVFEDEWYYSKEIVKSILNINLKYNIKRYNARECNIKLIDNNIKSMFLKENHLQGDDISSIRIGAFYKDILVSVMTFSKPRISTGHTQNKKDEYELVRFCNLKNTIVNGIFGKMFNFFKKKYNPLFIVTYSDNRYFDGKVYETVGFTYEKDTSPNYWYVQKNKNSRHHRFGFRKSVLSKKLELYDNSLSEWQNMQVNGYDRIWDCGNKKYIFKSE